MLMVLVVDWAIGICLWLGGQPARRKGLTNGQDIASRIACGESNWALIGQCFWRPVVASSWNICGSCGLDSNCV